MVLRASVPGFDAGAVGFDGHLPICVCPMGGAFFKRVSRKTFRVSLGQESDQGIDGFGKFCFFVHQSMDSPRSDDPIHLFVRPQTDRPDCFRRSPESRDFIDDRPVLSGVLIFNKHDFLFLGSRRFVRALDRSILHSGDTRGNNLCLRCLGID